MLLSSHIGGAAIRIRVAPTSPDLAAHPNLSFVTRAFISRARDPYDLKKAGKL